MGRRALVTGGAGFVGRHLLPKLEKAGYAVTVVDPRANPRSSFVQKFQDVSRGWLDGQAWDVIIHLAANIPDIHERVHSNHAAYADICLDYEMAEYVYRHPPKEAFIWPTSCAVDFAPDPYAWIKLTGERIFGALKNVPLKIIRPFSGYGQDQAISYPFPAILERAKAKQNPLTVWGSGTQVRDFIHIDDLTDAFMWSIDHFPIAQPIEIGTGVGTDFLTLAKLMADSVGYEPIILAQKEKEESSRRRVADPRLAEMYGFKPKISLERGIEMAIECSV